MIDKNDIKEAKIKEPVKNEFYDLLKIKFPQTINSDGAVNFDAIKMLLGIAVKENIKGYELNWIGKGLANALYNTPCDKELKFEPTKSKDINSTQNIIIKGDNLDALKLLKSAYYEKIKMIYIDPPYNTKNDDFIYPDDFRKDYKQICIETGLIKIEIDEFGNETEVLSEAMNFFTSVTSTKSHSGWLSFMLPRLKLARDLLRDDGVIFISIDDNEQANLKILCDEIFGEENFVADFIRKTKSTTNDAKIGINYQHEFLLCYAKNKENINLLGGQKDLTKYKNPDNDPNGAWIR
ncbi:DNA methyltransferase [Campylobacter hyointestinalis subsp. hyointestinalis]|uniref:DNA methyltransferase n=1 Tax=Campylobacter hyointestinalis subsp. hyointestinalis TaxID=91352 RepID=A0A9W5ARG1_CAMHY|nr:DNA methyltransferase [Campylobacter hyointestinalis subsp. hyointestinalis]CUU76466.1 DNA methyltransferase [Campylobacter hyointestinalis subsp. hyointestinalis]